MKAVSSSVLLEKDMVPKKFVSQGPHIVTVGSKG